MSHIIDADKLLKFVEEGMRHSKLCSESEPIEHIEDMRLDKDEWSMLEKIGYPKRFKSQKGEEYDRQRETNKD